MSQRMKHLESYAPVARSLPLHRAGLLAASLLCVFAAQTAEPAKPDLRTSAGAVFKPLPDRMPGAESDTPAQVALGKTLYFEPLLSQNKSQSCNTCHRVDNNHPGVDNEPTSPGAFGKRGDRNSPTTWNAGFHLAQFWDGRAPTLEEQAKGPVLNPVEMAMPTETEVVARLKAAPGYADAFTQAFPGEADAISYNNMARAIAAFERTLISHDRFDEYLKGNDQALDDSEKRGLALFLDVGCTTCHNGPLIGATAYHKVGLVNPYENTADKGRSVVTQEEDDEFKFKVPSLRNVALTYPYFHDGRHANLGDAVKKMAWMQLARELEPAEVDALVAFLQSLSGKNLQPAKQLAGS